MEKMKNNLFIMAGAMIAALSLGACSEDDTHGVDLSKPISLSFQPAAVVTKATVGVAADASFDQNDKVGVYVDGAGYSNVCFTAGVSAYCDLDLTVHRTHISISGFSIGEWKKGEEGKGNVTMDY